jgi:hypothetical protein
VSRSARARGSTGIEGTRIRGGGARARFSPRRRRSVRLVELADPQTFTTRIDDPTQTTAEITIIDR